MSLSYFHLFLTSDLKNVKMVGILGIGSRVAMKTYGHLFWQPSKMTLPVSLGSNHLDKQKLSDTLVFSRPSSHFVSGWRYRNYLICIMY